MGSTKKTRIRRTSQEIEETLYKAAETIIGEHGYHGLSMRAIYHEANTEHAVFYKRFEDLNDFLEKFARRFDYWLNDSIKVDIKDNTVKNAQKIMSDLIDVLIDNPCIQKLLIWEMSENNYITQRTAQNRDNNCQNLTRYFMKGFKDCEVNFNHASSILIGGIYYIVLFRKMGTFNLIDYSEEEAIKELKETINIMVKRVFTDYDEATIKAKSANNEAVRIAKSLLKKDVSYEIVKETTRLDDKTLKGLQNSKE
ncbi:TetR/AcrR family transcriptional regulator [Dysgonomonas termitidis]|uniref:TetR/AcrR family transcriptional regulator n=1 Tax=Dysgonomonas termitidis TaxID=1516126 RepID=A0ABV9L1Y6_9BACT